MVKKKKSVERTKADKIKNKSNNNVLVKSNNENKINNNVLTRSNNENINKNDNTQITQIIFPPNMELRTKRKKRKGKSKAQKKKEEEKEQLLEMLKSKLNEYDNIQAQAQQKNIPIPDELALSVINQGDLKTNEDIENYINNITQKINALTELINKPVNLFSIGRPPRQGLGNIQFPKLPAIINPSMIPTQTDKQTETDKQTKPKTPETGRNPTREELEKLRKELEGEVGEKDLPLKPEPLKEGDLVEIQLRVGDKINKIQAPKGFEDIFNLYKKYIQDTLFISSQNEITKGVYHIPIEKYNQLIKDRDNVNKKYNVWFNNLPNRLKYYMEKTNNDLAGLDADIVGNTELEPKELSKNLFREQNIEFTEITQGNEKPAIEKAIQERGFKDKDKEKLRKDFDSFIADMSGKINIIRDKITKPNINRQKLDGLDDEVNLLESQMETKYNNLPDEVKLSALTENESWEKRFNDVRSMISNARNSLNSFSPIAPDPDLVRPEPIVAEEPVIVKPNQRKLTPEQEEAKKVINKYISSGFKKGKSLTPTIKTNIRTFFGEDKGNQIINDLKKYGNTKEKVKAKKKKLDEYMRNGFDAVNVLGVM